MPLPFEIMLITDDGPELLARVKRALAAPRTAPVAVQLRMKSAAPDELLRYAHALRTLTREHGDLLLINGSVEASLAAQADGVHLPAGGVTVRSVRARLGPHQCVGVSCHTKDELLAAAEQGANYALLSPIHPVPGKAPALGVSGFAAVARLARLPVLALGGVIAADVSALKAAGASGIAVMRSVLSAPDPEAALSELCACFRAGPR